MFCKYCGKEIEDNSAFCSYCGKKLDETTQQQAQQVQYIQIKQPKSQTIAFVLCFFVVGLLGFHDFYMGYFGRGITKCIIMAILGWIYIGLIIVGIWCLLDLVNIITKSDVRFYSLDELNNIIENPSKYTGIFIEEAKKWKKSYYCA